MCHYISTIMMVSCILSTFISNYLAFSHLYITKFPLKAKLLKVKQHILSFFALSLILTFLIFFSFWYIEGNSIQPLTFCVLLGNPGQSTVLKLTSWSISVVQIGSTINLIFIYLWKIQILKVSKYFQWPW